MTKHLITNFKILFTAILASCTLSITAAAQITKQTEYLSKIAGIWLLDVDSSRIERSDRNFPGSYALRITTGPDFVIIEKSYDRANEPVIDQYKLYIDNRGETNEPSGPFRFGPGKTKSKTVWKNNQLTRRFNYKIDVGYVDIVEKYMLGKEPDTLIFEARSESKFGMYNYHRVLLFRKKI